MKNQTVGYVRVSSLGQNASRQLVGVSVDRTFTDYISGSIKSRPQLDECLAYVRQGDTLVVDSIDRLARNLRDLQSLIETLNGKGVSVQFIKENLLFTGNSDPMSTLMLQMMGAFSEFERSMIRSRQREGIEQAKKNGIELGRPPTLTTGQRKRAKQMKETGMSITEISRQLKISRPSVYNLLKME